MIICVKRTNWTTTRSTCCSLPIDGKPCELEMKKREPKGWQMRRKTIEEKLKKGITLVIDRYAFSGVAFSTAKGLDFAWCKQPDVGLISPDLVLFLDLSIDEARKRGGFGEERYEKYDLQIKVRKEFRKLKDERWKVSVRVRREPGLIPLFSLLTRVKVWRRLSKTS